MPGMKIQKENSKMLPPDTLENLYGNLITDKRLSVSQFSIYMALILLWHRNEFENPFPVSRKSIMELAHVHSIVTYHKCIGQLEEYGYIQYSPSYSYYKRSTIYLENYQRSGAYWDCGNKISRCYFCQRGCVAELSRMDDVL